MTHEIQSREEGPIAVETASYPIELAKVEDAEAIAHVHKMACLATYPSKEHGISEKDILTGQFDGSERIQKWRERIQNTEGTEKIWVARNNNEIIGFCYAVKTAERSEIYSLYIHPEYWKKGIGKRLMDEGLKWLGADQDVVLEVVPFNANAVNFYKNLGFEANGRASEFSFAPHNPHSPDSPAAKIIPLIEMVRRRVVDNFKDD